MLKRIWELDYIRGIGIIGVILYHVAFDLQELYYVDLGKSWQWAYNFAAIFILLAGTSSAFSRNNLSRGMKLGAVALAITLITYQIDAYSYVRFGILHLISFCILFYHFILHKWGNKSLLITAFVFIIFGFWLNMQSSPWPYLFIFGLAQSSFESMDYFPILPWLGFFMLGIVLARTVYQEKRSIFKNMPRWITPILFLGRHSLLIYLVHQPIAIFILNLAFLKKIW